MKPRSTIGAAVKQVRVARLLTQEDFVGISGRTYIGALERGEKMPTLRKIEQLAGVLGIHPLTLITLAFLPGADTTACHVLQQQVRQEIESLAKTGRSA